MTNYFGPNDNLDETLEHDSSNYEDYLDVLEEDAEAAERQQLSEEEQYAREVCVRRLGPI
jgi:hypothetical protein